MNGPVRLKKAAASGLGFSLGLVVLAGCAGQFQEGVLPADKPGSEVSADYAEPVPAEAYNAPLAPPNPASPAVDRLIARSAAVYMVVGDAAATAAQLRALVASFDGSVMAESLSLPVNEPGYSRSVMELLVPPERFDEALDQITNLGQVSDRRVEAVDVTDQVVDTESRVQTMRESIDRLQDLMKQSGSVADIAAVEAELTVRQAELESWLARQQSLMHQVQTSSIRVEMSTKVEVLQFDSGGFWNGLKAGWRSLGAAAGASLTILGALLPWLVAAALITVPIVAIRRRRRHRRPAPPAGPGPV